jgi:hypothetical protein
MPSLHSWAADVLRLNANSWLISFTAALMMPSLALSWAAQRDYGATTFTVNEVEVGSPVFGVPFTETV